MISTSHAAILVAAGVLAGMVGTAGAITTLVSYPALLAVGLSARSANVANLIALVACWPGAALASGPELQGRGGWLWRYAPVAAVGGAVGAAVLLATPTGVFDRVVPFLVAIGSISLLLAPRLSSQRIRDAAGQHRWFDGALLTLSVYNGYFGAGTGVMVLALLLMSVEEHLPAANALKNMVIGAATLSAALAVAIFGSVDWAAVAPLAAGMFAGSTVGPRIARRVPASLLRPTVAVIGIGLAIQLWLSHGS